ELHGEVFLVPEVRPKADDTPEAVILPTLLPRIQRVARRGAVADAILKIKVVRGLEPHIGEPQDTHPDVVTDFDKVAESHHGLGLPPVGLRWSRLRPGHGRHRQHYHPHQYYLY